MKNLRKLAYVVLFGSLLLLDSCLPTDEVVADRIPALTSSTWVFSSLDAGDDFLNTTYEIIYSGNEITFNEDGTCKDKLVGVNGSGTWSFNSDQTILNISISYTDGDTRNESWKIISLTDTKLNYEFSISPNTLEMIYTH
ncbi:MAG: hypothetical protein KDC79_04515 [Cyclobacteriaceae bacterium]|nr:hypothetical protein [Cyclobacteriaceae bacterium]